MDIVVGEAVLIDPGLVDIVAVGWWGINGSEIVLDGFDVAVFIWDCINTIISEYDDIGNDKRDDGDINNRSIENGYKDIMGYLEGENKDKLVNINKMKRRKE